MALLFEPYPHVLGGAQRVDALLAATACQHDWDVEVLVTAEGPAPAAVRAAGGVVGVVAAPPALARYGRTTTGWRRVRAAAALPAYWARVHRAVAARRAAVVHVVDHRGMLLAGAPARSAGASVVWHLHAVDRERLIDAMGSRLAAAILVPSSSAAQRLAHLPAHLVRVVGNPLLHQLPSALPDRPTGATVLSLARHHPDKGSDVLIRAWPAVVAACPSARLRIVGPTQVGAEEVPGRLRALAAAVGVADSVAVFDPVADASEELRGARVYVQASRERTESFGLAVLEAMAAGVPVVATDVAGLTDLVADRRTGLLVPPEQPEALAAALVELLTDEALADRVRAGAFERAVSEEHRPDRYVERITGVWEAVAS